MTETIQPRPRSKHASTEYPGRGSHRTGAVGAQDECATRRKGGARRAFSFAVLGVIWASSTLLLAEPPPPQPPPSPVSTATVELVVVRPDAAPFSVGGRVLFEPSSGEGESIEVPFPIEGRLRVQMPLGSSWRASGRLPGLWVQPLVFSVTKDASANPLELRAWHLGRLVGRLKQLPASEKSFREVEVRFGSPPFVEPGHAIRDGVVRCPADEHQAFRCELPAALLDVAIAPRGFVPRYVFGSRVSPEKDVDVGEVELRRGSSVAGSVRSLAGSLPNEGVRVELRPLVAPGADPVLAERLAAAVLATRTTERGFFQLGGVGPGTYQLRAAAAGFAAAVVAPVEVYRDAETRLREPIPLDLPLDLRFVVSPPVDSAGQPWRLKVVKAAELTSSFADPPCFDGPLDPGGAATVRGQSPGLFWVSVVNSGGSTVFSDTHMRIAGRGDALRFIDLELIELRGWVRLGDEPLAARLFFGGKHGTVAIRMLSDEEGQFSGSLPRSGRWPVELESDEPRIRSEVQVEVVRAKSGPAKLEIVLPDTVIEGRVVDEQGEPVSRAEVFAWGAEMQAKEYSGAAGRFTFRGFRPGLVGISGTAKVGRELLVSEETMVNLQEGTSRGLVELRVAGMREVRGRIESEMGPVAGAAIDLVSVGWSPGAHARSDLAGEFVLRIPRAARFVHGVVSPPGHALTTFQRDLGGADAELQIRVDRAGGIVELDFGQDPRRLSDGTRMLFYASGEEITVHTLVHWANGHGMSLFDPPGIRIPDLAPGEYTVCMFPMVEIGSETFHRRSPADQESCVSGFLGAGATLRLKPPRRAAAGGSSDEPVRQGGNQPPTSGPHR